jgi:hypothetical protein
VLTRCSPHTACLQLRKRISALVPTRKGCSRGLALQRSTFLSTWPSPTGSLKRASARNCAKQSPWLRLRPLAFVPRCTFTTFFLRLVSFLAAVLGLLQARGICVQYISCYLALHCTLQVLLARVIKPHQEFKDNHEYYSVSRSFCGTSNCRVCYY